MPWSFQSEDGKYYCVLDGELLMGTLDHDSGILLVYGGPYYLEDDLMKLLLIFLENAQRDLKVEELCRMLWSKEYDEERPVKARLSIEARLRKHIQRLRKKLGDERKSLISNVKGQVGIYRFTSKVTQPEGLGNIEMPNFLPTPFLIPTPDSFLSSSGKNAMEFTEVILLRSDGAFRVLGFIPEKKVSGATLELLMRSVPNPRELLRWAGIDSTTHPALLSKDGRRLIFGVDEERFEAALVATTLRIRVSQISYRDFLPESWEGGLIKKLTAMKKRREL